MNKAGSNHQWFSKLMAATFLGTTLIAGFIGVTGRLCHSSGSPRDIVPQSLVWLGALLWALSFSTCFMWSSAKKTWCFYIAFNIAIWGCFIVERVFFP